MVLAKEPRALCTLRQLYTAGLRLGPVSVLLLAKHDNQGSLISFFQILRHGDDLLDAT